MNVTAEWAISLTLLGRSEEALAALAQVRPSSRTEDIGDQISLDIAEGLARATLGDASASEFVARARVRTAGIDMVVMSDLVALTDAHVHLRLGDPEGARRIALELIETLERRGTHAFAATVRREVLDALEADAQRT